MGRLLWDRDDTIRVEANNARELIGDKVLMLRFDSKEFCS